MFIFVFFSCYRDFIPRQNFSNIKFEKKYNLGIAAGVNHFKVKWHKTMKDLFRAVFPIGQTIN